MIFKIAASIKSFVYLVSRFLNYIAMGILMLMMLLIIADIFMRNVLNSPILGSFELVEYMMAVVIFFFFPNGQVRKGNISVDMFINKMPDRVRSFFLSINYLICTVIFFLMSKKTMEETIESFTRADLSATLSIPHWPFVLAATIGMFMLTLVLLIDFISYLNQFIKGNRQTGGEIIKSTCT
ncbi:MAG: TRAP transporter small permease [Dehalobacterium sp.]